MFTFFTDYGVVRERGRRFGLFAKFKNDLLSIILPFFFALFSSFPSLAMGMGGCIKSFSAGRSSSINYYGMN